MTDSTAIIPFQGKPTAAVQEIMKQIVADRSKMRYNNKNVHLMMWLFDSDSLNEALLYDWALEWMRKAHGKDTDLGNGKRTFL